MNATTDPLKDAVSFVAIQVSLMPITVENASKSKRIEMVVPRLSIWDPLRPIYSTNARNTVSKRDNSGRGAVDGVQGMSNNDSYTPPLANE
jgi:hypothetical protein